MVKLYTNHCNNPKTQKMTQTQSQTQSPTKPTNNNLTIDFANDNFCAFSSNNFQSKNFKNNPYSPLNASSFYTKKAVRFFLTLRICGKTSFCLEDDSRQGLFRFTPKPVFAKNAVCVFLTLKPNISSGNLLAKNMILNVGNNLNV